MGERRVLLSRAFFFSVLVQNVSCGVKFLCFNTFWLILAGVVAYMNPVCWDSDFL